MSLTTGRRLFPPRGRRRAGDFRAFLRAVHSAYRGRHVATLPDEDPSHTAKGSVRLAEGFGMGLPWLPKRSPRLNPVDTLWGQGKDVVCAGTQHATTGEQVDRFIGYPESLSAWDALHTAGVYSRDFWLGTARRKYYCGFA